MKQFEIIRQWRDLQKFKKQTAFAIDAFNADLERCVGGLFSFGISKSSFILKRMFGAKHINDMHIISQTTGMDLSDLVVANLGYELAQAGELVAGCTSCCGIENGISVHYRNLDWWLPGLDKCVLVMDKKTHKYVTFPGFVGALTGIRKGQYSIAMNQVPSTHAPNLFGDVAAIIVREVLENCASPKSAISRLMNAEPIFPAFAHVVDVRGNATVVQMLSGGGKKWSDAAITNHDPAAPHLCRCRDDSVRRYDCVAGSKSMARAIKKAANESTIYSVKMKPLTGELTRI